MKKHSDDWYAARREKAVAEVAAGASGCATAKKYGVDHKTVYRWCQAAQDGKDLLHLRPGRPRAVRCVETGVVYASETEAGRDHYVSRQNVSHAAKTGCRAAGYHWAYMEAKYERHNREWYAVRRVNAVAELAAGERVADVAEKYEVKPDTLYRWYSEAARVQDIPTRRKGVQAKPVRCVETGVVYKSCKAAAEAHHVSVAAIRHAATPNPTAAGYHWEYMEGKQ